MQEGFSDQAGTAEDNADRGFGFHTNSELRIRAEGKTDAGMKWRAHVELETDTSSDNNTDELSLQLSGSWGTLRMGNDDGPEDLMDKGSEQACGSAGSGCTGGDAKDWSNIFSATDRFVDEGTLAAPGDSSDATKIVYFTPRINGFQLGVGYTPDGGASGQDSNASKKAGQESNHFGFGVNYEQKFDGFNVALGAVGAVADADREAVREDLRAWRVGGVIGFGAFKIGAGYQDIGDSLEPKAAGDDDSTAFDVGIGWSQGPVKLGLGWLHAEVEDGSDEHESDLISFGATYSLGKGLVVYADLFYYDIESATTSDDDNEAFGLILGTTVRF